MNKYLIDYYNFFCDEENRLISKYGKIEYLTTLKYILDNTLKNTKIIELGAGTGRYSIELSRRGYDVTALELVEHNINILKSKLTKDDHINIVQGNALDLSNFQDNSFDNCLILGPMYHLFTKHNKIKVLEEAKRITKNKGLIFVAYCMNEATIIQWGFKNDGANILNALDKKKLTDNFHCISNEEDVFELIRLEEIDELNKITNLKRIKIVGTDMFSRYIKETINNMSDEVFNIYYNYHLSICERSDLLGMSNHTLDILENNKE